jgi:hypothetical protein
MTSSTPEPSDSQFSGMPGLNRSAIPGISNTRFSTSLVKTSLSDMYSRRAPPGPPPERPAVMEAS